MPQLAMIHVRVYVRLKPALLDTAGRTVETALHRMGWPQVRNLRIGKLIEFQMENGDEGVVREMCDKLLANPVIEDYSIELTYAAPVGSPPPDFEQR